MKKEFTEVTKKTMFKKTGWQLLLMLVAVVWAAVMPAVSSAEWTIETLDTSKTFDNFYQRAIAIDSSDHPHIAYGGKHLYHAYFDGIKWQNEVVDNALNVGNYASIAIDSNDNVHISYYDLSSGHLKYATNASGAWMIETVDTTEAAEKFSSIAIDSNDNIHISYLSSGLKYATNASGAWVIETLDIGVDVVSFTSIAVDSNDNVHISYNRRDNDLKYATNASGAWLIETLDEAPVGPSSIAIDSNDNVHIISYTRFWGEDLKHTTNASGAWVVETVDEGPVGSIISIAIGSNDNVHISYYDWGNGALKYATNASGLWMIETVDTDENSGEFPSIAIDSNNNVHISYSDWPSNHLKYATNTSGAWVIEIVDTEVAAGLGTSIAIGSNNNLHISYYDSINRDLKYTTNASGAWMVETVDTEGNVGRDTSIAIDSNNNVHISYSDETNRDLKYATNTSGAWVVEAVDTEGDVGRDTSIAIDSNDNVHISYYGNGALKYATNTSGAWKVETLDTDGSAGYDTSIAIDSNNNVHISYYGKNTDDLKYATNASGVWMIETVDTAGIVGRDSSIVIDSNDNVHISYHVYLDFTNYGLKYATNASGAWVIETVDTDGNRGRTSIAIDSNDNVHISNYDWSSGHLKYVTNTSGSWVIEIVDTEGGGGFYSSIAIDSNDNVHISYYGMDHKYATNAPGVQSVLAEDAYERLITDPTAVMFDTRTVDEHNGYCPPWDQDCGGQIDINTTYAGTPQWAVGGVEKLPITLPYWYAGITRNTGPPEDEAQIRNIIEGALAANIIDFDTPIYLISRTGYRSYYIAAWVSTQTFTNPATNKTSSFTNLFNIDADGTANNDQGGMQEWNAATLPIFDGTIVPPQVFSGYPENGSIETSTNDVIFVAGVLEPTTGGFVYPDVTEVLLYIDGNSPVPMTQVDEAVLRAFFSISDDVLLPGKVYMATQYLPDGIYVWNIKATNSAGASWNLHILDGSDQGQGQRTLTVNACSPSGDDTDCNGRDDDCDGIPDNNYVSTPTTCGIGICESTGTLECVNGSEVNTCVESTPETEGPDGATCSDSLDNDCDGAIDLADPSCVLICTDNDGDGYAVEGGDCGEVDCNDSDANVNPGAVEICDGLDNNCDGSADEGFDADGDGYTTCGGDCDDTNPDINLGSTEGPAGDPTCSDGLDNDCDGAIDNADSGCVADDGGERPTRRRSGRRGGHGR